MMDPVVLKYPGSTALLQLYQQHEVNYEVTVQPVPGLITFWREVTEVIESAPLKVTRLTQHLFGISLALNYK